MCGITIHVLFLLYMGSPAPTSLSSLGDRYSKHVGQAVGTRRGTCGDGSHDGVYVPSLRDTTLYSALRVQLVSAYCFPATVDGGWLELSD